MEVRQSGFNWRAFIHGLWLACINLVLAAFLRKEVWKCTLFWISQRQDEDYAASTPNFKTHWFGKSWIQVTFETSICHWHSKDVSTKPHNGTSYAFVQLYLWSLMVIFVHMLLLTVHKVRQSALACNQCVMLLLALPINIQARLGPTR